jgi:HlyD family secretion protein
MKENRLLEIRSDSVEEIISKPPRWIVRWGVTMFFALIVLLLAFSWFVKYPDVVRAPLTLTTRNVPATLMARASGKITGVFFQEGDSVSAGDLVAVIENPANYREVLKADSLLAGTRDWNEAIRSGIFQQNFAQLGGINSLYSSFLSKLSEYADYLEKDYDGQKIRSLRKQLNFYDQLVHQQKKQAALQEQQYTIAQAQYRRDSALWSQKVLSDKDFEESKKAYLRELSTTESMQTTLVQTMLNQTTVEQELIASELQRNGTINKYHLALDELKTNIGAAIAAWKQEFLLISNIDGKVTFSKVWQTGQNVQPGEAVATVIPYHETSTIGIILLPPAGSGKVKVGHRVNITLDNFPYLEYGMLTGKVKSISTVPADNNFRVEIEFPEGLKTNYGKDIPADREFSGTAEIVTDDRRLLIRLVSPLRYFFEKSL